MVGRYFSLALFRSLDFSFSIFRDRHSPIPLGVFFSDPSSHRETDQAPKHWQSHH